MVRWSTLLIALPAVFIQPATVLAQAAVWENGQPVFRSDRGRSGRVRFDPGFAEPPEERYEDEHAESSEFMTGGGRPEISPQAPTKVAFPNGYGQGTIIIDTSKRTLYYTLSTEVAFKYPISVGRQGFKWYGTEKVSRIQAWPSWTPPAEMRKRQPNLPERMEGGIRNPLGAKAIYLGNTLYRIHGTNDRKSIGRAASSGCFRMMNKQVLHLAALVEKGTPVHVMRNWSGEVSELDENGERKKKS